MARLAVRVQVVQAAMAVVLAALVVRAAQVQLIEGGRWSTEARVQRTEQIVLAARRGALVDRHGRPLARPVETYHVGVAPTELSDPARDGALIARQRHLSLDAVRQSLQRRYRYF